MTVSDAAVQAGGIVAVAWLLHAFFRTVGSSVAISKEGRVRPFVFLTAVAVVGGSIFSWPPDLALVSIAILGVAGYAGFEAGHKKPMSLDEAFEIVSKWGRELERAQTPTESQARRRFAASRIMELPLDSEYKSALRAAQIIS